MHIAQSHENIMETKWKMDGGGAHLHLLFPFVVVSSFGLGDFVEAKAQFLRVDVKLQSGVTDG